MNLVLLSTGILYTKEGAGVPLLVANETPINRAPIGTWQQDPHIPECDLFVHDEECRCEECDPEDPYARDPFWWRMP